MNIDHHSEQRRDFWIGLLASIAVHAAVVVVVAISWWVDRIVDSEQTPPQERAIEVVLEVDESEEKESETPDPTELAVAEAAILTEDRIELPPEEEEPEADSAPEPIVEEEEVTPEEITPMEEPAPLDPSLLERYAVEQNTNEAEPEEADHISDQANRVEEEVVADTTTLEDVPIPEEELEAPLDESETELELAMRSPEELSEPELFDPEMLDEVDAPPSEEVVETEQEAQQEVLAQPAREYLDPSEIFAESEESSQEQPRVQDPQEALSGRDFARAEEVLGAEEQVERSRTSQPGRRLLSRWQENADNLRASLENFLPHIQTGNHTSVNAKAAAHASYIARMHRRIHARWALRFIPNLQSTYSNAHPLNDMNLMTVVEIVIDAASGEVLETGRVSPSGNTIFDGEALMTARDIGAHPEPPASIVSPDGRVYIHWTFWRDQRQCGSFGVRILRLTDESERREIPGEEADPGRRARRP